MRVAAASSLAQDFADDRAFAVLLAALRDGSDDGFRAAEAMTFLPSPHVIEPIARARDRVWPTGDSSYLDECLERLCGEPLPLDRPLADWFDENRHRFPPQHDPEAIAPAPVVVGPSDGR